MSIQTAPRCAWLVLVLAFLFLSGTSTFAQVTGATLSGKVTDSSGAVVVGAHIVIEKMDTGITREAVTNAEGLYSAPNLAPGTYEVSIRAAGFATQDMSVGI
jgi:hypothetical protein